MGPFKKYGRENFIFCPPMYTTPVIDWDTHWYTGALHISTRLSVCMPDNIDNIDLELSNLLTVFLTK